MASKNVINLSRDNFESIVLKSDKPALVDFWAEWCGPCRMLAPTIDELADEYNGRINICKVNVDENPDLANAYGISSIPTLLLFKNGTVVEQHVGVKPKSVLKASLEKLLQ